MCRVLTLSADGRKLTLIKKSGRPPIPASAITAINSAGGDPVAFRQYGLASHNRTHDCAYRVR